MTKPEYRKKSCPKCGRHSMEKIAFADEMQRPCYYWHCSNCGHEELKRHYFKKKGV
jgi:predicted RNA-binding Zn-ribbon protein involved in translation (DUF1610 family)